MGDILVVAEHLDGKLRDVTAELVSAAALLVGTDVDGTDVDGTDVGGTVALAVIAADPASLHDGVRLDGVGEIIDVAVDAAEFENDVYQAAVLALVEQRHFDAVVMGFTVNLMGYGAAVAAALGGGFASDVFGIARDGDTIVVTRAMYGGKVHAELELPVPAVIQVRPTAWAPAAPGGSPSTSEVSLPHAPTSRARHQEFIAAQVGGVDITCADFLLSIGRGIESKDKVPFFEGLAEKMSAVLSGSRPLIDSGWLPGARQVGQSGKTVKPKVYLAMGISGAVQHLAGIKASGTIIAVNSDPEASIFGVADYGAVADLFEIAEELEKLYS
ncbi:MAG: electron transfer flavoprotein subunit alpha/FixB family protein [Mycobacteriales bacterium]